MIKVFCDKCGIELGEDEVAHSLDMTGKELCYEHTKEIIDKKSYWSIDYKKWNEKAKTYLDNKE